jgi:RNA-binding protein 23/39
VHSSSFFQLAADIDFLAHRETERDWDKELASDVKEECENKYGGVAQIFVQRESLGDIYVKYADVNAAEKAVEGLNGRFFGGRSIKASL